MAEIVRLHDIILRYLNYPRVYSSNTLTIRVYIEATP